MKLQVNASGSWRNVLEFPAVHLPRVLHAADGLPDLPGESMQRLALLDDSGIRYYRSFEHDGKRWKTVWRACDGSDLAKPKPRRKIVVDL